MNGCAVYSNVCGDSFVAKGVLQLQGSQIEIQGGFVSALRKLGAGDVAQRAYDCVGILDCVRLGVVDLFEQRKRLLVALDRRVKVLLLKINIADAVMSSGDFRFSSVGLAHLQASRESLEREIIRLLIVVNAGELFEGVGNSSIV